MGENEIIPTNALDGYSQALDTYGEQFEAAYQVHVRTYSLRVPPPAPEPFDEPAPEAPKWSVENIGSLLLMCILVLASVLVSGSRTIPEFGHVGIPAFIMLEVGLIAYAFIRTSRGTYDQAKHDNVTQWVTFGMIGAFVVLLVANIDNVLTEKGIELPPEIAPWVDLVIQLLVAVSAPVLAFISGDVLGMFAVIQRQAHKRKNEEFQALLDAWKQRRADHLAAQKAIQDEWREGLNNSWNSVKGRLGVQLQAPAIPSSVQLSNGRSGQVGHGRGYDRNSEASNRVREYLAANPEHMSMGVRELAALIGVGKSTVGNVLRDMRGELAAAQNGNGAHE